MQSAVKWLVGKIDQVGCRGVKIALKSDQEESIVALKKSDQEESIVAIKKAVAVMRQASTVSIESPVRDSQANGNAERAVRAGAAQVRTMRHHLEHRLQHKILVHGS